MEAASTHPKVTDERLRAVPASPGVYLMKDERGDVIYIGKAKNLRSRVRSYFSRADERYTVDFLLPRVASVDTLVTADERQAILLEADLIKKHKPRYNIRLKDDKAHLLVRIDMNQEWPRLELVRAAREDGAIYLGPFAFGYELRTLLEVIKRSVPLRTCSDSMLHNRLRPCIEYQIKRCAAPCCLPVEREEYMKWVQRAVRLLQGRNREVLDELELEMELASSNLQFEAAAAVRDRLEIVRRVAEGAQHMPVGTTSQDAFGIYREGGRVELAVLMVRNGRLLGGRNFGLADVEIPDEELLPSLLTQFYEGQADVPENILVPFELEDKEAREELYRERRGSKVSIVVPKIGAKVRLLELATANARENFAARFADVDLKIGAVRALQQELGLETLPRVIECADVSHFQGGSTVGSVVSFRDGRPQKARYRHFNLSQEGKADDFASMREIVRRHLSRAAEENELPDLMVIDGGPAQLAQALHERRALGLQSPAMIGLAKKRTMGGIPARSAVYAAAGRKPERIYFEDSPLPKVLQPQSEALHLLERVRNEAHRFAITFHRNSRARKIFRSSLENIQGVGPKRRKQLLRTFGSIKAIAQAEPAELVRSCGVPEALAERIVATLRARTA